MASHPRGELTSPPFVVPADGELLFATDWSLEHAGSYDQADVLVEEVATGSRTTLWTRASTG